MAELCNTDRDALERLASIWSKQHRARRNAIWHTGSDGRLSATWVTDTLSADLSIMECAFALSDPVDVARRAARAVLRAQVGDAGRTLSAELLSRLTSDPARAASRTWGQLFAIEAATGDEDMTAGELRWNMIDGAADDHQDRVDGALRALQAAVLYSAERTGRSPHAIIGDACASWR